MPCLCLTDQQNLLALGKHFSYSETMGTSGTISSYLGTLLLYVGGFLLSLRPLRPLFMKVMPKPGQVGAICFGIRH